MMTKEPSTIDLVRKYFGSDNIGEATLKEIASFTERKSYEAGDILYREHDASEKLYVVHSGQIDIQYLLANGRRKTVDTQVEGDFMVWSAVVPPHQTNSIGICRAHAEVLAVDGEKLRALCEKDLKFGYKFMSQIASVIRRRLQAAREQIADLEGIGGRAERKASGGD